MQPATLAEAASMLRELAERKAAVRPVGARTKASWGPRAQTSQQVELETGGLARILAHDHGDFTAVLEAGVPLRQAQATFAEAGQRLALDPPLGADEDATIGGVLASADSGPARHRYGGARDLVIGVTVVLSDGTVARAGGKVIKNVAGYDLCKLFVGSAGTLGLIAEVCVRLHPLASTTATLDAQSADAAKLTAAAARLSRLPLEADCLDLTWERDEGRLLVRFSGPAASARARAAEQHVHALEHVEVHDHDEQLWADQRARQRSPGGAALKVSALPSELALLIAAARDARARLVARAALGICWLAFAPSDDLPQRVASLRTELAPRACAILDGGERLYAHEALRGDGSLPVGATTASAPSAGATALMERVRERFDPAGIFRPGVPLGEI